MTPPASTASQHGFSLIELLVALTVAVVVTSAVFAMLDPANGAFQSQPEAADVEQRLRGVTDVLYRDLVSAGGGPAVVGAVQVPVGAAALFPYRLGRRNPDVPGSFDSTRVSFWSVAAAAPQSRLSSPLATASGTAVMAPGAGCPDGDPACGFRAGATLVALAPSGAWDAYSVVSVQGSLLTLQHNMRDGTAVYPADGTVVAEGTLRTYFLRDDPASGLPQLARYDGASGADVPVIDHVASLAIDYYGDPDPPMLVVGAEPSAPRSTYGPPPPDPSTAQSAFPSGENCVFARTAAGAATPRLPSLGGGAGLVQLDPSMLTDGPWCPDATSPNRYDADLLRVREVVATVVVEAAVASLRGPAGPLFTRAGTARGNRFVPDRQVRLVVVPRALNVGH